MLTNVQFLRSHILCILLRWVTNVLLLVTLRFGLEVIRATLMLLAERLAERLGCILLRMKLSGVKLLLTRKVGLNDVLIGMIKLWRHNVGRVKVLTVVVIHWLSLLVLARGI